MTRLLIYLVIGTLLALAGVALMVFGRFHDSLATQLFGVAIYAAAVPLLFQAKLTKLEQRIRHLEHRLLEDHRPRQCSAAKPAPDEDE